MAHQYMPKIFYGPPQKTSSPPPTYGPLYLKSACRIIPSRKKNCNNQVSQGVRGLKEGIPT